MAGNWSSRCRADLASDGMFNLEGLVRPAAPVARHGRDQAGDGNAVLRPQALAQHLFQEGGSGPGPRSSGPAQVDTINHTVCGDQIPDSVPGLDLRVAAVCRLPRCERWTRTTLFTMRDPLARMNVMCLSRRRGPQLAFRPIGIHHDAAAAGADRRRRFPVPLRSADRYRSELRRRGAAAGRQGQST